MAEYLFTDLLKKRGIDGVEVYSRGTSAEEEGNPCHYGTKRILDRFKIDCSAHKARKITKSECDEADLLVCMDQYNVWRLKDIAGSENHDKIKRLLDIAGVYGDVDDPWYTHDFERCYKDISTGLNGLINYVKGK